MKKCLYLALLALVLVACVQSQQQKAEALIKDYLKTSLYNPETYKPVETKVDSAFAPYDDPVFFEELAELGRLSAEHEKLEETVKEANETMAQWSGSYKAVGKKNYQEAEEAFIEANERMELLRKKGREQYEKVTKMALKEPKFIGYKAAHNYHADNNSGETLTGDMIFFIDEEFTKIIYALELESYDTVLESIRKFKEENDITSD